MPPRAEHFTTLIPKAFTFFFPSERFSLDRSHIQLSDTGITQKIIQHYAPYHSQKHEKTNKGDLRLEPTNC